MLYITVGRDSIARIFTDSVQGQIITGVCLRSVLQED